MLSLPPPSKSVLQQQLGGLTHILHRREPSETCLVSPVRANEDHRTPIAHEARYDRFRGLTAHGARQHVRPFAALGHRLGERAIVDEVLGPRLVSADLGQLPVLVDVEAQIAHPQQVCVRPLTQE